MNAPISGATVVAGVVGSPVRHSLSPLIHNAWLAAAGLDGVYVAFSPPATGFQAFCTGLRGGAIRGLNVTAPFKEEALALADEPTTRAVAAGSANLLLFEADGRILADSTDGRGLLRAFVEQAPGLDPAAGRAVILGAGGAARAAAAAFAEAGAPEVILMNRTFARAEATALALGGRVRAAPSDDGKVLGSANVLINATPAGLSGSAPPPVDLTALPSTAVVMDMIYRPLRTGLLEAARGRGLCTVDGLAMLIGQARPSFEALFGAAPPAIDVRTLAEAA
ncbi:MAG TPA: shikimate dehydrogenase [Caulobacteraceae bacterium]|jgi:shikimate dehydrogenase|nr:shikimate dehydrogenase [Caulobacteraceae bacterium]